MERINLFSDPEKKYRIVAFGAHPDDIELGCGGTLKRILKELPEVEVWYIVFSYGTRDGYPPSDRGFNHPRAREAWQAAGMLGVPVDHRRIFDYKDTCFPERWAEMQNWMYNEFRKPEEEKGGYFTHVFTTSTHDIHQDHRTVAENTWRVFRYHIILEYEIPKYEGDLRTPNLYVQLSSERAEWKVRKLLWETFKEERPDPDWSPTFCSIPDVWDPKKYEGLRPDSLLGYPRSLVWDPRIWLGLMRMRGLEVGCDFAEGFHVEKIFW